MLLRVVLTAAILNSGTNGTSSCFGTGNTSRNHPIPPAKPTTTPTRLTNKLVTNPNAIKVTPSAVVIGHAVGIGICTPSSLSCDSSGFISHEFALMM